MWNDVEHAFQVVFELAWEAHRAGTVPIAAVITNEAGDIIATAKNQIFAKGEGMISNHSLAHAETNAILMLSDDRFPDIREFTLYTNVEPCYLCFGAIVMSGIRKVKYAQRDPWAGAVEVNGMTDYLKLKNIAFKGPFSELEFVSIVAMQMCYELKTRCKTDISDFLGNPNMFTQKYISVFPDEMALWERLAKDGILKRFVDTDTKISETYNFITDIKGRHTHSTP